jgi:hypothetical protein
MQDVLVYSFLQDVLLKLWDSVYHRGGYPVNKNANSLERENLNHPIKKYPL